MVTQDIIDEARNIMAMVAPGTGILAVPDSVAFGDNPAITLKKPLQVSTYRNMLVAPEVVKYVASSIVANWPGWAANIGIDTVLVNEGILAGKDKALKCAVIWHEQGHVVHGAAESGSVYLFEVQSLANAVATNDLQANDVTRVVTSRVSQYRKAVDPGKAALAAFVLANWNIVL
jgi:hypothetical protein